MIFECALACTLLVGTAYELYVIMHDKKEEKGYGSDLLTIVAYFPIWTLVHGVLLLYTWIPRGNV